jgi:flagellar hook protein FlgE
MSNYSIALSGLQNTSSAIDSVSNNIANSNTVGFKAGEYLFADQFVRAVNPADSSRVGMGVQNLGVRRANTQGTITNSANQLDLAISGNGMYRLLKGSGTAGSARGRSCDCCANATGRSASSSRTCMSGSTRN